MRLTPLAVLTLWTLLLAALFMAARHSVPLVRVEIVVTPDGAPDDSEEPIDAPETGNAVNSWMTL